MGPKTKGRKESQSDHQKSTRNTLYSSDSLTGVPGSPGDRQGLRSSPRVTRNQRLCVIWFLNLGDGTRRVLGTPSRVEGVVPVSVVVGRKSRESWGRTLSRTSVVSARGRGESLTRSPLTWRNPTGAGSYSWTPTVTVITSKDVTTDDGDTDTRSGVRHTES